MNITQLPMVYNLDKIRVYKENLLVAEFWGCHHVPMWYLENDERTKPFVNKKIQSFAIQVEGAMSDVLVLEIMF